MADAQPASTAAVDGCGLLRRTYHGDCSSSWSWSAPRADGTEVRPVDGAGLGVFALRRFSRGDRILSEAPLVQWTSEANAHGLHDFAPLEKMVDELDAPAQWSFFALCQSEALYGRDRSVRGVWSCNAYPTPRGDGLTPVDAGNIRRSAVFAHICRINHACHPSCHIAWNDGLGTMTVHALREIAPGEELSVAYMGGDTLGTRSSRQAHLRSTYDFACRCGVCSLTGAALAASDTRQRRLAEIHTQLARLPPHVPALVEELQQLHADEGMPLIWAKSPIFAALLVCRRARDLTGAMAWARKGASCARVALGADAGVTKRFEELAETLGAATGAAATSRRTAKGREK